MSRSPDCVSPHSVLLAQVLDFSGDSSEVVEPAPKRKKFRIQDGKMRDCTDDEATPVSPTPEEEEKSARELAEFLQLHPLHGWFVLSKFLQIAYQPFYKPLVHEHICFSALSWEPIELEEMLQEALVAVDEWSAVVCH